MLDEDTDAELKIVTTSFADPYLLVLRDDSSIVILKADASGDVEELDRGEGLMAKTWLSGSVYKSSTAYEAAPLLYLLNAEGALQVSAAAALRPIRNLTASSYRFTNFLILTSRSTSPRA